MLFNARIGNIFLYSKSNHNKMQQFILALVSLLLVSFSAGAQDECSARYRDPIFPKVKKTGNIYFGEAPMAGGAIRKLYLDIYEPEEDTASLRPVVILFHGGAFVDGLLNRKSPDIVAIAQYLAQRGYVTASVSYRGIKNLASLGREKDMVQGLARALIDANDGICYIMETTRNGNPFRIDSNQAFGGGVSAGAVIGLQGVFLESLDDLIPRYKNWVLQVDGGRAEEVMSNKFCGGKVKGIINIAGCLLDTAWIRPSEVSLLLIHGTEDNIMPYDIGYPLAMPTLPKMMGSKPIYDKAQGLGMDVVLKSWERKGHVPFLNLGPDDVGQLLSGVLTNEEAFQETLEDIRDFLFERIICEEATVISQNKPTLAGTLSVSPNPSTGQFSIQLPHEGPWSLEVMDIAGRLVTNERFSGSRYDSEKLNWQNGMYLLRVTGDREKDRMYTGKVVINR
jgi:hypothetical protein